MTATPTNWSAASNEDLRRIKGVCFDIDDTFSSHGQITAEAFAALHALKKRGFWLIPVTGRPAGWCDHIARFWPVNGVVGENGAFSFYMKDGVRRRIDTPHAMKPEKAKQNLKALARKIKKKFPRAQWASDQAYREYDLAIDICEDVKPWPQKEVIKLLDFCHSQKAKAKLSSIHVNTWFGDYDKKSGLQHFLKLHKNAPKWNEWIYIGDSPNDEPLFEAFPLSVGVANLKPYLKSLQSQPRWITKHESGAGFAEFAHRLLSC